MTEIKLIYDNARSYVILLIQKQTGVGIGKIFAMLHVHEI